MPLAPDRHTLAEWHASGAWWLRMTCGCRTVFHPLRMLIEKHGAATPVEIAARMKCSRCGGRPAVWLTDNPARRDPSSDVQVAEGGE